LREFWGFNSVLSWLVSVTGSDFEKLDLVNADQRRGSINLSENVLVEGLIQLFGLTIAIRPP
jgi:hypothetical protein